MSEHTPGPWKARVVHSELRSLILVMAEGPTQVARITEGNFPDARLIAAAPDLLAACKEAFEELQGLVATLDGYDYDTTRLREAIAKAEVAP